MATRKRTIGSYAVPRHDDECGIRRNEGMTTIAALAMDDVHGIPLCDCGLVELLEAESDENDGKLRRGERRMMEYSSDVIIDLHSDGTYKVVKDRKLDFKPRNETVYGIRTFDGFRQVEYGLATGIHINRG